MPRKAPGPDITSDTQTDVFHTAQESHDWRGHKTAGKTRETLSLFATAILPIMGALGTLFVFLFVNFYVGDVEIQLPSAYPYQSLEVHAYNPKGQEAIFRTPHFQLMPDKYHFEVSVNAQAKQHADASVKFHKKTSVLLVNNINSTPAPTDRQAPANIDQAAPDLDKSGAQKQDSQDAQADESPKKHWWQLWKKSTER